MDDQSQATHHLFGYKNMANTIKEKKYGKGSKIPFAITLEFVKNFYVLSFLCIHFFSYFMSLIRT